MFRKGLAVAVILLFIGMCIVPSTAVQELKEKTFPINIDGNTLYVGGSGANNYTTIQSAIDNASDGDTVFVYNGTYYENIIIRKSINLIGENKDITVIDGIQENRVVWVKYSDVNVSGFTIKNSTKDSFGTGILIENPPTSDLYYVAIYDNIIIQNNKGIRELGNSHITIHNNILSNYNLGIELYATEHCSVYENVISNNPIGIYILRGYSNIDINNNQILDNEIGLSISNTRTTIKCNNFIDNSNHISLVKNPPLSSISRLLYWRQNWIKNYYNEWMTSYPKPIFGRGGLYITIVKLQVPIAIFPYVEFDWRPAQEPYDIEVL